MKSKMNEQEIDALLEEGSALIDALVAKHGSPASDNMELEDEGPEHEAREGEQPEEVPPPGNLLPRLVEMVRAKSMFRDVPEELILEAVARTPDLSGLSPSNALAALESDPDMRMTFFRVLARLTDEAEGRTVVEKRDGNAEPRSGPVAGVRTPGPAARS